MSGEISPIVFVDRKAVGILLIYYSPIPSIDEAWPIVPWQIEGVLTNVETSPIH